MNSCWVPGDKYRDGSDGDENRHTPCPGGAHEVAGRTDTNHDNRMGCVVRVDDHPEFLRAWALPLEPHRSLSLPACVLHRAECALLERNGDCSNRMFTQQAPAPNLFSPRGEVPPYQSSVS